MPAEPRSAGVRLPPRAGWGGQVRLYSHVSAGNSSDSAGTLRVGLRGLVATAMSASDDESLSPLAAERIRVRESRAVADEPVGGSAAVKDPGEWRSVRTTGAAPLCPGTSSPRPNAWDSPGSVSKPAHASSSCPPGSCTKKFGFEYCEPFADYQADS